LFGLIICKLIDTTLSFLAYITGRMAPSKILTTMDDFIATVAFLRCAFLFLFSDLTRNAFFFKREVISMREPK